MEHMYLPGNTRERIQDLIKNRNVTQAELADVIGLSESAFSRYLQGRTEMLGDGYIIRIAKYFDVSTDFLLGETDIPDRKNYDIEELGLSAEAARLLFTGRINAHILNLLLENPRFPALTTLLSRYQNEVAKTGLQVINQQMTFYNSLLLEQAANYPDSAEAARQAAQDIQSLKMPEVDVDLAAIQELFMEIVKDMKEQAPPANLKSMNVNSTVMEQFRHELTKGQNLTDLKNATSRIVTDAVINTIAAAEPDVPEELLQKLGNDFKELLDRSKENINGKREAVGAVS